MSKGAKIPFGLTCALVFGTLLTRQADRRTQSIDTSPEVERLQIARIRSFSPARKFASVRSWTHTITSANLHAMHSGITEPDERDIAVRFVRREYGKALAADFQAAVEQRPEWTIQEHDLQVGDDSSN